MCSITHLALDQSLTRYHRPIRLLHILEVVNHFAHLGSTIPDWAPPAFQVLDNPLADRRDQGVELFGRRGFDPVKSQLSMALGREDAINKQCVKMQVQIQC